MTSSKIVPEPNSEIIIVDDMPVEPNAMLQALYSRDPGSVRAHIEQVKLKGAEHFMSLYYVQYGHASIGDCGSTTMFFENCSLLMAKVVQDWRLYNGQEASTRYIDMDRQDLINPCEGEEGQKKGEEILSRWMKLYREAIDTLVPLLKEQNPIQEGQKQGNYEKAIKAKAFDIARGFLPGGVATFTSWHTNLRQAHAHLHMMTHHPLKEMRDAANQAFAQLREKYPSSFSHKEYPATEEYLEKVGAEYSYFDLDTVPEFATRSTLELDELEKHAGILGTRPIKTEVPSKFEKFGQIRFRFPLDFGSFRDLQRHRSGVCEMPLLTTKHGFHSWYLSMLPDEFRAKAIAEIAELTKLIEELPCDKFVKQYYTAIGFTIACEFTGGLPSIVYISEIRSTQAVHPTLRVIAQKMGRFLQEQMPYLALHVDYNPDEWTIKRGSHDIVKKEVPAESPAENSAGGDTAQQSAA